MVDTFSSHNYLSIMYVNINMQPSTPSLYACLRPFAQTQTNHNPCMFLAMLSRRWALKSILQMTTATHLPPHRTTPFHYKLHRLAASHTGSHRRTCTLVPAQAALTPFTRSDNHNRPPRSLQKPDIRAIRFYAMACAAGRLAACAQHHFGPASNGQRTN